MADARPLPPGTILQRLYFKERLRRWPAGRFVEVGAGEGVLCESLLQHGWRGTAFDLNAAALERAAVRNAAALEAGRLELVAGNWLERTGTESADLVLSSMVLEHLDDASVTRFLDRACATLTADGRLVTLVPASPAHWGIEDEIAGHLRRYTASSLRETLESHGWLVEHVVGLTYPLSNLLLRLSNRLVSRYESGLLDVGADKRTIASGRRSVPWKTSFPIVARLALNPITLYPFHLLQKATRDSSGALVLYAEARTRH